MSEWISVRDSVPDDRFGLVLIVIDGEAWKMLNANHYDSEYCCPIEVASPTFVRAWANKFITHWMPLPEMP